jgi:hypothetical protein
MLIYDIHPDQFQQYFLFMQGEFVPTLSKMGLHMIFAWQIHGDGYPDRQVEFVCETVDALREALASDKFKAAEDRLKTYTTSYKRKIVRFENRFQF